MAVIENNKTETLNKLSLLSEVRSEGYDTAVRNKFGEELAYIITLKDKSNDELYQERIRLRNAVTQQAY